MNLINNFRKNILYFFLSLPFVIVLYEFLMAIMLGNRGYTILLLGQVGAVPFLLLSLNLILSNNLLLETVTVLSALGLLGVVIYGFWYYFNK